MHPRVTSMHRFLDRPLSVSGRLAVVAGIAAILVGAALPLWRITLVAPQYAEGLTLDMHSYKLVAGNDGNDLNEINLLNHYIGMRPIVQRDFVEMQVIPFAIGAFVLLGLRAVVIGRIVNLLDLAVLFA